MRETLEEIKYSKIMRRGCVPNLWGASPVGCDEGGRSYTTQMVSKGRPKWQRRGRAESWTLGEDVRAGAPIGRPDEPVKLASRD